MSVLAGQKEGLASIRLDDSWKQVLGDELLQPYMRDLSHFLKTERAAGKIIFPRGGEIFQAFNSTPFEKVRVVILGQDPYHGPGQAHGLCFSVRPGIALPPSLQNIYKELYTDLGIMPVRHGCLQSWANQGVLLLNSVLTVEAGQAASHQGKGWERFSDAVIRTLNQRREHLVFILWGGYAQKKGQIIDTRRHLVLKSAHPSPLSANRGGFFGCRHFSRANEYLQLHGLPAIEWQLAKDAA